MTKVERIIAREVAEAPEKAKRDLAVEFLDVLTPKVVAEKTGLSLEEILELKKQK